MAGRKTIENNVSVRDFLNNVSNETRRVDSRVVVKLMQSISYFREMAQNVGGEYRRFWSTPF